MKNKSFLSICILTFFYVVGVAYNNDSKSCSAYFKDIVWDFDSISPDSIVYHDFLLHNIGDKELIVLDATVDCGCTKVSWPEQPIVPGDSATITVRFNPLGRDGEMFSKKIKIRTNGDPKIIILTVSGIVKDFS